MRCVTMLDPCGLTHGGSSRKAWLWRVSRKNVSNPKTYDVLVVGAGVFGAWTALQLARRGQSVLLVDAYGPSNARASSGGESRIIRMGYGADELYTRWATRSLACWKELLAETMGSPALFHKTGVLWLGSKDYAGFTEMTEVLTRYKVPFESLNSSA